MSYVNQIQDKEQETHDIHDKRLTVSIEDVGKVVGVNEDGQLALLEVSGGTKLYKHVVQLSEGNYNRLTFYMNSDTKVTFPNFANLSILSDIVITKGDPYPQSTYQVSSSSLNGIIDFGNISGSDQINLIKLRAIGSQVNIVYGSFYSNGTYNEQTTYLGTIVSDTVTLL